MEDLVGIAATTHYDIMMSYISNFETNKRLSFPCNLSTAKVEQNPEQTKQKAKKVTFLCYFLYFFMSNQPKIQQKRNKFRQKKVAMLTHRHLK